MVLLIFVQRIATHILFNFEIFMYLNTEFTGRCKIQRKIACLIGINSAFQSNIAKNELSSFTKHCCFNASLMGLLRHFCVSRKAQNVSSRLSAFERRNTVNTIEQKGSHLAAEMFRNWQMCFNLFLLV